MQGSTEGDGRAGVRPALSSSGSFEIEEHDGHAMKALVARLHDGAIDDEDGRGLRAEPGGDALAQTLALARGRRREHFYRIELLARHAIDARA
jgi:hypothetical protein